MRPIRRTLLAFLAITIGLPATVSYAAVQNRITSAVQGSRRVSLAHTVSPRAARAADLGAAPSSRKLEDLTLHFSMTDAQQAALNQLLLDQQNPTSPRYHQWLTPEQFGAQFGLSASDLAKVSSWLTSQGFTITGAARSSTFVTFSGTVGQVQEAFGTTVHSLSLNGEDHIANLTEPALPAAIAGVVSNLSGLDDFRLKPHNHVRRLSASVDSLAAHPKDTITLSNNTVAHFIAPGDFAAIYNLNPLLTSSTNGANVTIAVMGQVDLSSYLPDAAAFRVASNLSVNTPTQQLYGTNPGAPTSTSCNSTSPPDTCNDVEESELDVEWAGATAPSAKIIYVTSTNVVGISLVNAIDNNLASIMTISYGGCEVQNFSTSAINTLNQYFQQANTEGITIIGPSGDSGATDCDPISSSVSQTVATHGLAVDFPASSPYVTGIGGTEFNEGADTSGVYWDNTVNSSGLSASGISAKGYIPEMVWNDTASEIASNPTSASLSASGGGASAIFSKPVWQTGTGVPADGKRDVPDLAFSASANHDAYLVCAIGSCQSGTYFIQTGTNAGSFNAFGGTSVSTPSFAGILALVEQKLGTRIGNANPYIYALANGASYSSVFHDVTTGDNKQPCTGCTSSPIGFSATGGYDQATGWGSLNVSNFANAFSSVITTPLPIAATLALSSSASNPALGQSITITATVGYPSGSPVPTGKVTFTVDGDGITSGSSSTPVTVDSSGVATFTTSFSANGRHSIFASYSGDTNYYAATASTTIIAGPIPTGTISLTAAPSSTTVASAGSISSIINIQSSNGYAGTVNLSAVATSLDGSYTFIPTTSAPTCVTSTSSITLGVGASGTCTFTVSSITAGAKGKLHAAPTTNSTGSWIAGGGATLAAFLIFTFTGASRRRWPALLSLLAVAALMTAAGCSSSSSTTAPTSPSSPSSGAYTITVIGTDSVVGTITASTTINVTIN